MNPSTEPREATSEYRDDLRRARVQLSRIFEPADRAGMALLHCLGPITLLETVTSHASPPAWLLQKLPSAMATWGLRSKPADLGAASRPGVPGCRWWNRIRMPVTPTPWARGL
ncbi:hypothetical protein [Kocuria atrinae]|uniref:hypothetical protein n=1 Tax=Kocuria atrinae TaxID=592377 RepID=UPI001CB951E2|nr:hypothetical protein [Kocuria atrinae]